MPLAATDLYVFAPPAGILHLEEGLWIAQSLDAMPASGILKQTAGGRWCLGAGGILLRESAGQWSTVLGGDDPDSYLADVTESPDGTVFLSQFFLDQDLGRVHRISLGELIASDELEAPLFALAATATDTVWGAGTRVFCFDGAAWDTVVSIPDSNRVVAIGRPAEGSLTLVCERGPIYRLQDGVLTTVQEFDLIAPLASVCYIDETTIFGSLNYTDPGTGHATGLIVRYNGEGWVTVFLAPPS